MSLPLRCADVTPLFRFRISQSYASAPGLKRIDLDIRKGESSRCWVQWRRKTTLINIVCGIVTPRSRCSQMGMTSFAISRGPHEDRLVPQELTMTRRVRVAT